jgi:hypothetical protein
MQTSFHGRFLGMRAAAAHGLVQQSIVDLDIRPHGIRLDV